MEIAAERRGILSRTILTCGPNQAMGELHDRMPVILSENDWPKWLGEEAAGVKEIGCRVLRNVLKNFRACLNAAKRAKVVDQCVKDKMSGAK